MTTNANETEREGAGQFFFLAAYRDRLLAELAEVQRRLAESEVASARIPVAFGFES